MMKRGSLLLCLCLAGPCTAVSANENAAPIFHVSECLFDPAAGADLGLQPAPGTQTFTIFRPEAQDDAFNNGVVLVAFKDRLYAQWQSSQRDEDSADTWVAYSHSDDQGETWSAPAVLVPAGKGGAMHSSGGWWTDGQTLVAYTNVWPTGFQSGDGGYTEYRQSSDGVNWSAPQRVMATQGRPVEGIIEQDPHALASGRIVTAFHQRPGMIVALYYTDDPLGISGWTRGDMQNLPHEGKVSRELEPSLFLRNAANGECAVMVFRDQASSYRQLAAESCDAALTWTIPSLTSMPDARAKQSAGNLPDATAFLVNAPNADRVRVPLAVTLAKDGRHFDRSFLLRGKTDLPLIRREGRYKRLGYHYPKSIVWNDHLYVAYTTNKEDVQLTRVPLDSLKVAPVH